MNDQQLKEDKGMNDQQLKEVYDGFAEELSNANGAHRENMYGIASVLYEIWSLGNGASRSTYDDLVNNLNVAIKEAIHEEKRLTKKIGELFNEQAPEKELSAS